MNVSDDIRLNIHLYAILDLAIKSVQHDQILFKSFKINRPYIALCEKQLKELNNELKGISKHLYKTGVKYEKYQCINKNICIYSFLCRGVIVPFQYNGDLLLEQVEKKLKLTWNSLQQDPTEN